MNNLAGFKTATLGWTALVPVVCVRPDPAGGMHFDLKSAAVGYFVATVLSALPDIDHPHSTAGRAAGPVMNKIVKTIGGGHRGLTHSLLALLIVWLVSAWVFDAASLSAALWNPQVQAAIQGLHPLAALHALAPLAATPLAAAAAEGFGAHILCDMMTVRGVPLFWGLIFLPKPVRKRKYRIASVVTGSPAEDRYTKAVVVVHLVLFFTYVVIFVITPYVSGGIA